MEKNRNIRLSIFPCNEEGSLINKADYLEAYNLWYLVWSGTLNKLDGVSELKSNEFTRHDFCSVIYEESRAIALFCYSAIDLSLPTRVNDSWFSAWPKDILFYLGKNYRKSLMPAWLAVHPDYRRSSSSYPVNLAQVTMEIYASLILYYGFQAGFGTTRNDRGVNKLIYETGGIKLDEGKDHGVGVDFVLMEPENIANKMHLFSEEFKYLWENKNVNWENFYERPIRRRNEKSDELYRGFSLGQ